MNEMTAAQHQDDCLGRRKHPTKCPKCGGRLVAYISTVQTHKVNLDGTLGNPTDGGTADLAGTASRTLNKVFETYED